MFCKQSFSKPANCKRHEVNCQGKIDFIQELVNLSDDPLPIEDDAPTSDLQDTTIEPYSTSDGTADLIAWEHREREED
jgi:hypothetical protein